jgi:glycosyltransferase involved in cell wall biosynthesis
MNKISGYVCARNAVRLDYCVDLAVKSLAPVCDEVVVCDSDSDDGTREFVESLKPDIPHLRVVNVPWQNPHGDPYCVIKWMNRARTLLKYPYQLYLDADEVLSDDPLTYKTIRSFADARKCGWFYRVNFIKDIRHLIPLDVVCGYKVARLGPTEYFMPADEPQPEGECRMRKEGIDHPSFVIYHLGFLRHQKAMIPKVKEVQQMFFATYDRTIIKADDEGRPYWYYVPWKNRLRDHDGRYPLIAHDWLKERGAL